MAELGNAFGRFSRLPNERSDHQTPASLYIDAHYTNLDIEIRWSWERYVRLCNMIKMTPWEVASLVAMPHSHVKSFERDNFIPKTGRRAICLILTMVEAHFLSELHHDVIRNPFPDLNQVDRNAHPQSSGKV